MNRLLPTVAALCFLTLSAGLRAADKPAAAAGDAAPAKERDGLPLVFHEDFKDADKAFARFDLLDPTDWKMAKDADGRGVLSLFQRPTEKKTAGKPPVRSPFGRAIVKDLYVGEFVMDVRFKSTIKAYGHQDLCLFFGEQGVSHLYYVHFGRAPDPNAGNIFIVNAAPRKNLLPPHKKTVDWTEAYHTATVTRKADGTIDVAFDGKPYLSVNDKTFMVGRVGVGSFDDTGDFAEVTVWGKKAEKPAAPPKAAAAAFTAESREFETRIQSPSRKLPLRGIPFGGIAPTSPGPAAERADATQADVKPAPTN